MTNSCILTQSIMNLYLDLNPLTILAKSMVLITRTLGSKSFTRWLVSLVLALEIAQALETVPALGSQR